MKRLSSLIRYDKEFISSINVITEQAKLPKTAPIIINGLTSGAAYAYLAEAIIETKNAFFSPALILVPSEAERERVAFVLAEYGLNVLQYKSREFIFNNISASHDVERERLFVLSRILSNGCDAIITTPSAALIATMPRTVLESLLLSLKCNDEIEPLELVKRLSNLGFVRVDTVESAGQFSHRGGIIDVWNKIDSQPVRIEFFGDEIDRMVFFDPISQRAVGNCKELHLLPATEVIVSEAAKDKIVKTVKKLLQKTENEKVKERLTSELNSLTGGHFIDFRDKYIGLVYGEFSTLFSYFPTSSKVPIFLIDTNGIKEDFKKNFDKNSSERAALIEMGAVIPEAAKYMADIEYYNEFLDLNVAVHINSFSSGIGSRRVAGLFGFRCRRTVMYGDNPSMLLEDIAAYRKAMYRTLILAENKEGAKSIIKTLADSDVFSIPIYDNPDFNFDTAVPGQVFVDIGAYSEGYDLITPKIVTLSLAKDTGRAVMANRRRQRILRRVGGAGQRLMSYADLSVGDYVVHANYGIGLFEGIESVRIDGVTRDYITIRYAGTDKLFVPCDKLDYIGKYIGEKDKDGTVKLSKMGGGEWGRVKTKAKSAAKDIAKDLIRLYAERQRKPGFAFPKDSELEQQFASAFDYEETESQLMAIEEIKRDMMRPTPMNRLLCGDVGFGKTEVALRAAFKAIMGGKQVAFLVPTTILALQHYQTALSRMRGYAVNVEMLSRFRTPSQQQAIIRKTKRGEIDVLIGTHKLLSKKIEFKDLGLLIIDEEQRFGVTQKEKLKELAKNVDVLTLTATPIPRTLNMAMNGISDMSILDEAPGERRPVQTYVLEHDEQILLDAMVKELSRGGQVLYLYNRVSDIHLVASKISNQLPDARVAFAHGQMEHNELEDIWQMLVRQEIDILVCTTIIETGVDLPNANTLIIENADKMGLSQLHQIRGRVGRSSRQAYAFFTYRMGKALSEVAQKRLAAIREFAEFGAGFKVAIRDLEIRGAGNLLGAEQHGYIDSVGYDLYIKLLNEAVLEESGNMPKQEPESTLELKSDAHIPEYYISVSAQRMEMYKKISLISMPEDLQDVLDELIDRFGNPPRETLRLLRGALVRSLSSKCGIKKTEIKEGTLAFYPVKPDLAVWSELFGKFSGLTFKTAGTFSVAMRTKSSDEALVLAADILWEYFKILNEEEKKNAETKHER